MRVRVKFHMSLHSGTDGVVITVPSSFFVVDELLRHLQERFSLPPLLLSVSGFSLPASQALAVLKDGDLLEVRADARSQGDDWKLKADKQHKCEGEDGLVCSMQASGNARHPKISQFLHIWPSLDLTATSADYYFKAYNHYGVHEEVLRDTVTTSAFINAVQQSEHLLRGKVVLDVCAGLGFCSLLCARAGAQVIALEPQHELANMAERLARQNGYGSEIIQVVCADVHSLDNLPGGRAKVDVIISQWLGYCLLHDARLVDVLYARDRWLTPDGHLLPDRATLYAAALEDSDFDQRHLTYDNVWGCDFSAMKAPLLREPVVCEYQGCDILSSPVRLLELDLRLCCISDCTTIAAQFRLSCTRRGTARGLLVWFRIGFSSCREPVVICTGPNSEPTCWKQTGFMFQGSPANVKPGDCLDGMIAVWKPHQQRRYLSIKISCRVNSAEARLSTFDWH